MTAPKHPELAPMTSSLFDGHHYDPATQQLTVRMKGGAVYRYDGVPAEKAETFAGNKSPGSYFGSRIKGLYPATKL